MTSGVNDSIVNVTKLRSSGGVSICIPNWNHRSFLSRSVGSAVKAARSLKERGLGAQVLIIDDYSRDGSQRYLFSSALYGDGDLIDIIVKKDNRGLSDTRNMALIHAKYNIICFLDADNELIAENLYNFWLAMIETDATLVYGNLFRVVGEKTEGLISNDFVDEALYIENYIDAFCLVNADRCLEVGGYYVKKTTSHEDWELVLHLIAENEDIVFVPMLLGKYHVSNLSMVQTEQFDHSKIRRIFNQRGLGLPMAYKRRRIYHPALGWL